ncbi:phosphotransferase [Nonomuraea ferruginea]
MDARRARAARPPHRARLHGRAPRPRPRRAGPRDPRLRPRHGRLRPGAPRTCATTPPCGPWPSLLRAYHDATTGFTPPGDAAWYFPPRQPAEVVCHADIAPYNCVFRDGAPVAFIDFDTAHPGPRLWDVAYAAYRFVPPDRPGPRGGAHARARAGAAAGAVLRRVRARRRRPRGPDGRGGGAPARHGAADPREGGGGRCRLRRPPG